MSNKLIAIESKFDVNNMNAQELDLLQSQIYNKKFSDFANALKLLNEKVDKAQKETLIKTTELANQFEDLKDDNNRKLEVTINKMRIDKNKWGFGSQSDFGTKFKVSIGSKTVGLLFVVVGLAKKVKNRNNREITVPLRAAIISGKATTDNNGTYETYRWHHEKCLSHVEDWLRKHGILEKFYSIEKEKDLQKFIQDLYSTYCNDESY